MIKASGVLFSSCLHPFDELWLQENPIFNGLVDTEELKSLFWFKTKYGNLFSPDPTSNLEGFMAYLMIMPKISCIFGPAQEQTRGQQDCSTILELFSWSNGNTGVSLNVSLGQTAQLQISGLGEGDSWRV